MTYDSRALVYCNRGEVIEGTITESDPSDGLIKVTGSCTLKGVVKLVHGETIEFAYLKNNLLTRLGRVLYIIGSVANSIDRTTTVNFGCKLAYNERNAPGPVTLDSADDTSKPDLNDVTALALLKQITASFIVDNLLTRLGIAYAPSPLTNRFYSETEQVDGPYLDTVAELITSESYVAYMDEDDVLQYLYLPQLTEPGFVLETDDILSLAPAGQGTPLPDGVYGTARHKAIVLDTSLREGGSGIGYGGGGTIADPAADPKNDTGEELPGLDAIEDSVCGLKDISDEDKQDPILMAQYRRALQEYIRQQKELAKTPPPDDEGKYGDDNFGGAYFDSGSTTSLLPTTKVWEYTDEATGQEFKESETYTPSSYWSAAYNEEGVLVSKVETSNNEWGIVTKSTFYQNTKTESEEETREVTYTYDSGARIVEACGFPGETIKPLKSTLEAAASGLVWSETEWRTTISKNRSSVSSSLSVAPQVATSDGAAYIGKLIENWVTLNGPVLGSGLVDEILEYASAPGVSGGEVSVTNSGKAAIPKKPVRSDGVNGPKEKGKGVEEPKEDTRNYEEEFTYADYIAQLTPQGGAGPFPEDWTSGDKCLSAALVREAELSIEIDPRRKLDLGSAISKDYKSSSRLGGGSTGATYTYTLEDSPSLFFIEGGSVAKVYQEFTPPYVSDDKIIATDKGYRIEKSDASQKAMTYCRTQFNLLQGREYGFNVVYPVEYYSAPCTPAFMVVDGTMAKFWMTGTSIAFNNTGILMSSVALLAGAVGTTNPEVIGGFESSFTTSVDQPFTSTVTLTYSNVKDFAVTNARVLIADAVGLLCNWSLKVNGVEVDSGTNNTSFNTSSLNNTPSATVELTVEYGSIYPYSSYPTARLSIGALAITQVN